MTEPARSDRATTADSGETRAQSVPENQTASGAPRTTRIKGTREGLTISLGSDELPKLLTDLSQHLETQGAFFRGGRVAIDLGERTVSRDELGQLADLLEQYDMILRTVMSSDPATRQSAAELGLRLIESAPRPSTRPMPQPPTVAERPGPATQPKSPARLPEMDGSRGILVKHVVRSGQIVRHSGHVVVVGDINPGASVIAGGDIVVWGRLAGMAHAGSMGDETAIVCALEMAPMQLRIGQIIARPEDRVNTAMPGRGGVRFRPRLGGRFAPEVGPSIGAGPEIARVHDGKIVVDAWDRIQRGT
jgi:septum site-determining protein MinC